MAKLTFSGLLILLFSFSMQGADTIQVKQTRIPLLIDRSDNPLFYLSLIHI